MEQEYHMRREEFKGLLNHIEKTKFVAHKYTRKDAEGTTVETIDTGTIDDGKDKDFWKNLRFSSFQTYDSGKTYQLRVRNKNLQQVVDYYLSKQL